MKIANLFQFCLIVICFATIGCGNELTPEQSKAFIFLCGEKGNLGLRNKSLAKSAIDNYSKGNLKKALDQFVEIDSQGCAGERLPAFKSLIYAQNKDVNSFNVSIEDAFKRSDDSFEILSFIGLELEYKNDESFAFLTYEFAVSEIRKSLTNGNSREDVRGEVFAEDGSLVAWKESPEASLLLNSVCLAAELNSPKEKEYRRFYKTVVGYDPTCTVTHSNLINESASNAGDG